MSMTNDFVKDYVKHKLATAVSAGILTGRTESAAGHSHKFAVMFCENDKMFVGETSYDGRGPHVHYIMASVRDVTEAHLGNQHSPRNEDDIVVEVNEANSPAALRKVLDFYNLKEVRLETSGGGSDDHTHAVVLRYAGKNIDKMGRKVEASVKIEDDGVIEKLKSKRASALEELENRLAQAIRPSVAEQPGATLQEGADLQEGPAKQEMAQEQEGPDVEIDAETELKDEAGLDISDEVDGTPKAGMSLADRLVAECREKAISVEAELEARLKEHGVDAKCGPDHEK